MSTLTTNLCKDLIEIMEKQLTDKPELNYKEIYSQIINSNNIGELLKVYNIFKPHEEFVLFPPNVYFLLEQLKEDQKRELYFKLQNNVRVIQTSILRKELELGQKRNQQLKQKLTQLQQNSHEISQENIKKKLEDGGVFKKLAAINEEVKSQKQRIQSLQQAINQSDQNIQKLEQNKLAIDSLVDQQQSRLNKSIDIE